MFIYNLDLIHFTNIMTAIPKIRMGFYHDTSLKIPDESFFSK